MTENTEAIITCVTAIVGLITAVITIFFEYKRNISKQNKEDYYYKKVLKPFIKAYINNNNIDAINFVNQRVKREDDRIPKYIYYLLEANNTEMFKVLIYDYSNLYQNEENRMNKMLKGISKFLYYILFILSLIMLFFGAYAVTMDIVFVIAKFLQLIIDGFAAFKSDWEVFLRLSMTTVACLGGSYLTNLAIRELNYDRYTIKKRKIEKLIANSIKNYNNNIEKIVL